MTPQPKAPDMSDETIVLDRYAALLRVVDAYREAFGEPNYRFYKQTIPWSRRSRDGHHVIPVGDGEEVTETEFLEHEEETKRFRTEAFMGRLPHSYVAYEKKQVSPAWREHLIEDIKAARP